MQVNFIAGNMRSVNEAQWNENMKLIRIPKARWKTMRKRLVTTLLHELEHLFQIYWAHRYGLDMKGKN